MRSLFKKRSDIQMYDQQSFYKALEKDLRRAQSYVVIESPFITVKRIDALLPLFIMLRNRGIAITINTRDPIEHDAEYERQALNSVATLQSLGIKVLYTGRHHRKLAVIDKTVTWNGSLNILSHNDSCEIMWRVNSSHIAKQLLEFVNIKGYTGR